VESVLERIKRGHFWKFHGGIHPPEQKHLTQNKPIRSISTPSELILPIQQHIGQSGDILVKVGDKVLKGQPLTQAMSPMAVPIHAPTSGVITDIKQAVIAHPSGLKDLCIFLSPDLEEKWYPRKVCEDPSSLSKEEILAKIAAAGIAGMGGAGFPTHIKANTNKAIEFLIINAAECEPYITADDLLIREHSPSIVDGIKILDQLISPKCILIGIEDNKPEAIEALRQATSSIENLQVCVLPTKYPTGGEKQLIKILTGKEVPSGVIPGNIGIVMQNIATCFAIADAILNDIPLIKRVVTVSGQGLDKPQNVWALIGTPVAHLLKQCSYNESTNPHLIMGGPMMGYSLPTDTVPVVKTTNCILAPSQKEIPTTNKEVECIRCGQCADVCPSKLLPQELQWSAKAKDYDQLQTLNLFDCIECGACAYVCPSHIPLVHYYRIGKAEIRQNQIQEIKAEHAKARFEARKQRLEKQKQAREEKHRKAAEARRARMNSGSEEGNNAKSAVAAALARVKAKKATATEESEDKSNVKSQASAAIARAKAKKLAAQKAKDTTTESDAASENTDTLNNSESNSNVANASSSKQSKVAAAVAKAKAKKLAAKQAESVNDENNNASTDKASESVSKQPESKQDKIAAAVAKAKAKKLAAKQKPTESEPVAVPTTELKVDDSETDTEEQFEIEKNSVNADTKDSKKDKIAAAVAKAKAKKLAAKSSEKPNTEKVNEVNSAQEQLSQPKSNTKASSSELDDSSQEAETQVSASIITNDKKDKIAAAIAKAKAKKQAQKHAQENENSPAEQVQEPQSDEVKAERIAAAIAKAKAKKQQQSESQ